MKLVGRTLVASLALAVTTLACGGSETPEGDDFTAARLLTTEEEVAKVPAVVLAREAGLSVTAPVCEISSPERFPVALDMPGAVVFHSFLAVRDGEALPMVFASDGTSASGVSATLPVNDHARALGSSDASASVDLARIDGAATAATCVTEIAAGSG